MDKVLSVQGMTCDACAAKVTAALESVPGVRSADVSQKTGRAVVRVDSNVADEVLFKAASVGGKYVVSHAKEGGDRTAMPNESEAATSETPESLYPLFLIVGFIAGTVGLVAMQSGHWDTSVVMRHFMAGFFLVFSFFKFLDLRGFADAYGGYDLVARALPGWAWAYPFVELGLGVAYLLALAPLLVNGVTLVLMLIGAAGVLKALLHKRAIRCACLGTALNLPMTKVTLVEDLTMAAMAAAMLISHGM